MKIDQGTTFGTWQDDTSRLIYHDAMPALLNGINTTGTVGDYGGGNGLMKKFIPHATTLDIDADKNPDLVVDCFNYCGRFDLVLMRYLLHYMSDPDVVQLLKHIAFYKSPRILIIQFVNNDLAAKKANSVNESKWFRSEQQLFALVKKSGWVVRQRKALEYQVSAEFYFNRLRHKNATPHAETILCLELVRP